MWHNRLIASCRLQLLLFVLFDIWFRSTLLFLVLGLPWPIPELLAALTDPSLWNNLPPSVCSRILTARPAASLRCLKSSLFSSYPSHYERLGLACTLRGTLWILKYNTMLLFHLFRIKYGGVWMKWVAIRCHRRRWALMTMTTLWDEVEGRFCCCCRGGASIFYRWTASIVFIVVTGVFVEGSFHIR